MAHDVTRIEEAARARANGRSESARPTIVTGTDLHRVVDDACAVLSAARDVYQRDGELVRVTHAAEPDARRGIVQGTPQIHPVALATLRETLSRVATWERVRRSRDGSEQAERCLPPEPVCAAVLARREYRDVRPLTGVVETPCLRPDGSILAAPGYDAATGLLYEPSCAVPAIASAPTQADAAAALARLREVWRDFPFVGGRRGPAAHVPIAAVLTMLGRPAIDGSTPLLAVDAPTRGSGKTLVGDTIAMLTTGRSAPRMTYPPDEVELEKVLAACAIHGSRLVLLDNISGTLGAAPLDKVLTCDDRVALRVLGRTELRELAWRAVMLATGNNLVLGADTARRTLVARLEPDVERPEERADFTHPDLLAFVRARRGELVAAGLTILRGYVVAGRPGAASHVWGSYRAWAELIAGAIAWAGGADVLACRAVSLGAPEPEADALRALLAHLPALAPDGLVARDLVRELWPEERRRTPDGWDQLRDALEVLCPPRRGGDHPDPVRLGRALRRHVGRIVGGRRLVARTDRANRQVWSVEGGPDAGDAGDAGDETNPSRASETDHSGRSDSPGPRQPLQPMQQDAASWARRRAEQAIREGREADYAAD